MVPSEVSDSLAEELRLGTMQEVGRGLMVGHLPRERWGLGLGGGAAAAFRKPPWYFVFHFGEREGETQTGGSRLDGPGATHQLHLSPPSFSKGN